jgi:hypothetical protein
MTWVRNQGDSKSGDLELGEQNHFSLGIQAKVRP